MLAMNMVIVRSPIRRITGMRCLCGMDVPLNSHRAASPLMRLVKGEERWEAPNHLPGVLDQNWCGKQPNCIVT
ncbi:hypothetical protein TNCV_2471881 [Trichonephila clavipes]|nr:hypothetical protein TNCV_2471881 [Trichonephila clavipes]